MENYSVSLIDISDRCLSLITKNNVKERKFYVITLCDIFLKTLLFRNEFLNALRNSIQFAVFPYLWKLRDNVANLGNAIRKLHHTLQ